LSKTARLVPTKEGAWRRAQHPHSTFEFGTATSEFGTATFEFRTSALRFGTSPEPLSRWERGWGEGIKE